MVNRYIRLFLIPMPFCILLMLLNFCNFDSSLIDLFLKFSLGSSIHSVLLCERYFDFNSRTEKNFRAILFKLILFSMYFDVLFSFRVIWLFWHFGFHSWHGIILNTIQLFTLLPFNGSFTISFLGHTLVWSECNLKIVFENFLTLVLL